MHKYIFRQSTREEGREEKVSACILLTFHNIKQTINYSLTINIHYIYISYRYIHIYPYLYENFH